MARPFAFRLSRLPLDNVLLYPIRKLVSANRPTSHPENHRFLVARACDKFVSVEDKEHFQSCMPDALVPVHECVIHDE